MQSRIVVEEGNLPEDVFYLPNQLKPYTGKCVVYYSGTQLFKEEMTFREGILNGIYISYYKNGNIKRKGEYKDGKLNGSWQSWTSDGDKIYEVHYQNDTLSGNYISWYETGVIKERGEYAENRKKGVWVEYDEAGMIIRKKNF